MLKVTTTSSIEATVSPETKFNVQLKQTSLADEFTCAIMRWRIHAKKNIPGRERTGERYRSSDGRSVGRATNGDGGVHDPSIRPGERRERGRQGGRALREKRQLRRGGGDELKYKGGT